jgi:hypothetical protein
VAEFGRGSFLDIKGSPLIASTRGLTADKITGDSIFPQYTFHNDFGYGVYVAGGTSANGMTGVEVGFSVGGTAGITVLGGYGSQQVSPRLGVNNRAPLSDVHVGKNITISESPTSATNGTFQNFIGYNLYYDYGVGANRRIEGSSTTGRGAAAIQFIEKLAADTTTAEAQGTTIRLYPGGLGATGAAFINNPIFSGVSDPIYVTPYVSIAPNFFGGGIGGDNGVPSVRMGMGATDSDGDAVLGSLSIAARSKNSGFGVLDVYNLTLYDNGGNKGVGMRVSNNGSGTRSFNMDYMFSLPVGSSLLTSSFNENSPLARTVAFGTDFRFGVDGTVSNQAAFYSRGSFLNPVGGATAAAKFDGDILIGADPANFGLPFDIRTAGDPEGWVTYTMADSDCAYSEIAPPTLRTTNMSLGTKETRYKRIGKTCFMDVFLNGVNTSNGDISAFYIKLPPNILPSYDYAKFIGNGWFTNITDPSAVGLNSGIGGYLGRSGVFVTLTTGGAIGGGLSGYWAIVGCDTYRNFWLGGGSSNLALRYSITFELA